MDAVRILANSATVLKLLLPPGSSSRVFEIIEIDLHHLAADRRCEEAEAIERQRLEREKEAAEARLEHSAAMQQAAAEREAQARQAAVDGKETRAVVERLDDEAEARELERRAEQAERNAAALENAQNKD